MKITKIVTNSEVDRIFHLFSRDSSFSYFFVFQRKWDHSNLQPNSSLFPLRLYCLLGFCS